jgi:hypothetical protein
MPRKNEKGTKNIQEMMMVMSGLCSVALVSATADAGAGDLGCGSRQKRWVMSPNS